jgi:hypothetical protein
MTVAEKTKEYRAYILDHKSNVSTAWHFLRNRAVTDPLLIATVDSLIAIHDDSKFSDEEFEPYRKFFFPVSPSEKSYENFRPAWFHHFSNNPHHFEYWIGDDGTFKSTFSERQPYLVEMVCDWMAMGMHFGNTAIGWYSSRKDKIRLAPEDRAFVESLLSFESNGA